MVGGDEWRAGADGLAGGRDEANQLQPLGIGEALALVHGRADEMLLRRHHGTESEIAGRGAAVQFRARHVALLDAPGAERLEAIRNDAEGLAEIGRASCRESVCQYVLISVVAVSLKKK